MPNNDILGGIRSRRGGRGDSESFRPPSRDFRNRSDTVRDFIAGDGNREDASAALGVRFEGVDARASADQLGQLSKEAYLGESFGLRDEENARFEESLGFLQGQFGDFLGREGGLSQERANSMFAREADGLGQIANQDFDFLREGLGAAGITGGGLAAGLGAQVELQRLGQVTNAKRDIRIAQMEQGAQDAMANINAAFQMANFANQSPSMLGADALGNMVALRRSEETEEEAAIYAKRARGDAILGGAIGGGFSLLGAGIGALGG